MPIYILYTYYIHIIYILYTYYIHIIYIYIYIYIPTSFYISVSPCLSVYRSIQIYLSIPQCARLYPPILKYLRPNTYHLYIFTSFLVIYTSRYLYI